MSISGVTVLDSQVKWNNISVIKSKKIKFKKKKAVNMIDGKRMKWIIHDTCMSIQKSDSIYLKLKKKRG